METPPSLDATKEIEPLRKFDPDQPAASTDVGDTSWDVRPSGSQRQRGPRVPPPTRGRRPLPPA